MAQKSKFFDPNWYCIIIFFPQLLLSRLLFQSNHYINFLFQVATWSRPLAFTNLRPLRLTGWWWDGAVRHTILCGGCSTSSTSTWPTAPRSRTPASKWLSKIVLNSSTFSFDGVQLLQVITKLCFQFFLRWVCSESRLLNVITVNVISLLYLNCKCLIYYRLINKDHQLLLSLWIWPK